MCYLIRYNVMSNTLEKGWAFLIREYFRIKLNELVSTSHKYL
jgi:hypothetical protein